MVRLNKIKYSFLKSISSKITHTPTHSSAIAMTHTHASKILSIGRKQYANQPLTHPLHKSR